MSSGFFIANLVDVFDSTQLAINTASDTFKIALFSSDISPNFTTDTVYGSGTFASNEVSGTGYSSGGKTITGVAFSASSGDLLFDADDVSWTSATFGPARYALIYDSTVSNRAICLIDFGADFSVSNGTFAITWSNPIATIDLTP